MTTTTAFGRPRTRARDEEGNPLTKRISVYMDQELWHKLKIAVTRKGMVQNALFENLVSEWLEQQIAANPELEDEINASCEVIIPELHV